MSKSTNAVPASIAHALRQNFRKQFPVFRDALPLAIGIDRQIVARLPDTDPKVLRVAMAMHTKSTPYLRKMTKAVTRFNLDDSAAEELNESHRSHAATVLIERIKRNEEFEKAQREYELRVKQEAEEAEAARLRAEKINQLAAKFSGGDRSGTRR
jgi:ProP effector